jgi:hypothetical protein
MAFEDALRQEAVAAYLMAAALEEGDEKRARAWGRTLDHARKFLAKVAELAGQKQR